MNAMILFVNVFGLKPIINMIKTARETTIQMVHTMSMLIGPIISIRISMNNGTIISPTDAPTTNREVIGPVSEYPSVT